MDKLFLFHNSSKFNDTRKQDKQYIDEPSHDHFCREKATSITFLERILVIQHAMCMRRVILLPVACPAVQ